MASRRRLTWCREESCWGACLLVRGCGGAGAVGLGLRDFEGRSLASASADVVMIGEALRLPSRSWASARAAKEMVDRSGPTCSVRLGSADSEETEEDEEEAADDGGDISSSEGGSDSVCGAGVGIAGASMVCRNCCRGREPGTDTEAGGRRGMISYQCLVKCSSRRSLYRSLFAR